MPRICGIFRPNQTSKIFANADLFSRILVNSQVKHGLSAKFCDTRITRHGFLHRTSRQHPHTHKYRTLWHKTHTHSATHKYRTFWWNTHTHGISCRLTCPSPVKDTPTIMSKELQIYFSSSSLPTDDLCSEVTLGQYCELVGTQRAVHKDENITYMFEVSL